MEYSNGLLTIRIDGVAIESNELTNTIEKKITRASDLLIDYKTEWKYNSLTIRPIKGYQRHMESTWESGEPIKHFPGDPGLVTLIYV